MNAPEATIVATMPDIDWAADRSNPQQARLLSALLDVHRRLRAAAPRLGDAVAAQCADRLTRAQYEARRGSFYVAWDCLQQLDNELLGALSDEERGVRWCTLVLEAGTKLKNSWRGAAAEALIARVPPGGPVPLDVMRELHKHISTHAQNQQFKLDMFRRTLPGISALLALCSVLALAMAWAALDQNGFGALVPWSRLPDAWRDALPGLAKALLVGVPAGMLGGILSMAFSLGKADLGARIPDMRLSRLVTLSKPLLGATVAIPVALFVQGGEMKVIGLEGYLATFAFCFAGGFSERWFLNLMERRFGEEGK